MAGKGKRRQSIGALLLGVYEPGGVLRYAGRVGSGFDERGAAAPVATAQRRCERASSPFGAGEKPPRGAIFCEPRLVVEVEFTSWTERRQPAPPRLQGPARGQARGAGRARGHTRGRRERTRHRVADAGGSHETPRARRSARCRSAGAARAQPTRRRRSRAEAVEPRQGAVSGDAASPRAR